MNEKINGIISAIDTKTLISKEYILSNVLPKLAPKNRIAEYIKKDMIFDLYLDLVLSFYVPIKSEALTEQAPKEVFCSKDAMVSFPVTRNILDAVGIGYEELNECSRSNLEREATISTMSEALSSLGFDLNIEEEISMLVASTKNKLHGAALMCCPGILNKISKALGNYIVLPSSIHEIICIPDDNETDRNGLIEMVEEINAQIVGPEERLSDNIYIYEDGGLSCYLSPQLSESKAQPGFECHYLDAVLPTDP